MTNEYNNRIKELVYVNEEKYPIKINLPEGVTDINDRKFLELIVENDVLEKIAQYESARPTREEGEQE